MRRFCSVFIILMIVSFLNPCFLEAGSITSKVTIKNSELIVEWATTEEERIHGLQGRPYLGENEGMFFDYGSEKKLSFWMKDTSIPLSIAFIDKNGVIQEIVDMSPNSLESYQSKQKVRYALEVNQGWFNRNHVQVGDRIEL